MFVCLLFAGMVGFMVTEAELPAVVELCEAGVGARVKKDCDELRSLMLTCRFNRDLKI